MLLSFAMTLRYSFDLGEDADRLEQAISSVLEQGYRTGDIMQPGLTELSTEAMGAAVLAELDKTVS